MPNITIGRLRGGFCVNWYDNGKRRRYQLQARTRKEAEAEALDVYRSKNQPVGGATVYDCWGSYRNHLGERPTAKTLIYTGKAILPAFGHFRPDQLSETMCRDYGDERARKGISTGSVHTELGHLRSALKYAVKTGLIDRAPHIWRPSKPAAKERFLSHAEIRRLIDGANAPHIRLAIILLLGTAGRVGAILDLEWSRVDFERQVINLRLDDSKTRKGRAVVPMNGMTRAALQTAHNAALSDYVVEYGGERVKSIRKGFSAACKRAGLNGVTIHTLRHTSAAHMVSAGIPISKVAAYLGHSNTAMVEKVYGHYAPEAMADAAEVLNFTEIRLSGS